MKGSAGGAWIKEDQAKINEIAASLMMLGSMAYPQNLRFPPIAFNNRRVIRIGDSPPPEGV